MSNQPAAPQGGPQAPRNPRQAMLETVAAQQRQIRSMSQALGSAMHRLAVQELQIGYIASLAGVSPQVTAIRKKADENNPASPVPDPPSEGPFETTEQAATPETYDDVRNPGMTPGSVQDVAADTTDVALAPGESLPTAPFNDLVNVQAPIAGTEQQLPLDQTRIETDVRVGDPTNPQGAYPWTISPNQSNQVAASAGNRTLASLHLARLRMQAGTADTENDIVLGDRIATSTASDQQILDEISTLTSVTKAAAKRTAQTRPPGLVPRRAASGTGGVARTAPSLVGGNGNLQAVSSVSSVDTDTVDSDLFDG